MAKAVAGRNFQVLNFAYHLPKLWTDRFARVNAKQPEISNQIFLPMVLHYQVRHKIQL